MFLKKMTISLGQIYIAILSNIMQTSVLIIQVINKAGDHSHAWLRQNVKNETVC